MIQNVSDGDRLRQESNFSTSSQLATVPAANTVSTSHSNVDAIMNQSAATVVEQPLSDSDDFDRPQKFATEDTPLNFSQSGSLSDLSSVRDGVETEPRNTAASATVTKLDTTAAPDADDDSDVSLSDDDVPGGDDLLSHLIEAAMPKKRHHWKPAVHSNNVRGRPPTGGPLTAGGSRRPASRSLEPAIERASHNNPPQLRELHGLRSHPADSRKQHELSDKNAMPASTTVSAQSETATDQSLVHYSAFHSGASAVKPLAFSWTTEPSEDHVLSYAVEGTPNSYSRDRSPTSQRIPNTMVNRSLSKTGDASWNSSLSSLSFDSSLNAEPTAEESALLQECINAALPKSRGKKSNKKSSSHHQPLRTSPSGSSESSYKHRPVNMTSRSDASKTNPNITEETKSQDASVSDRQPEVANSISEASDLADIMHESLPDIGMLDIALDDENLPSGPSTEANNTVIYCGPALTEAGQSSLTASTLEPSDITVAADSEANTNELTKSAHTDVVSELSMDVTRSEVASSADTEPTTADLSSDQVHLKRYTVIKVKVKVCI